MRNCLGILMFIMLVDILFFFLVFVDDSGRVKILFVILRRYKK